VGLKRAFLAVVPPGEVLDAIDRLLERPKSSRFAWTRRDQWHVTMQFYGRVDDVDGLRAAIRSATDAARPARIAIRGGGTFPKPKRAQVFWLGVDNGDALIDLHAEVAAATRAFVNLRDRAAFEPHLTIARLKRTVDLTEDVDALRNVPIGPAWELRDLVLFESETRRSGAVYTEQGRFPLGG
jgi:RNA 2',3'-cyclic 3'-phosphodiesterase